MDRRNFLLSGTVFVSALTARAQDKSAKLEVQVSYTGNIPLSQGYVEPCQDVKLRLLRNSFAEPVIQ